MCEDHYLPTEYNYITYEATSGGLGTPDSDARMNYYNMGGIPDLRFDGNWQIVVGAGESARDGVYYMSIIDSHRAVEAPLAVIVSDFSYEHGSAFVEVTVTMFEDIGSPAGHVIRVAVVEDNLVYGASTYENVLRDMLPDNALTVSAVGEEQIVTIPFTMGAGWDAAELQLIAFVQRDTDKYVINSGNSFVVDYGSAVGFAGAQQEIAVGGQVEFATTSLTNVGLMSDTYDISIDTSSLPEGYDAHLTYEGSDYQDFSVALDPYATADFGVVTNTGAEGFGRVVVNVYSHGAGEIVLSFDFVAVPDGTDVLIVADDGGAGFASTAYAPAFAAAEKTQAIWDQGFSHVAGADLVAYDAVIWETGANSDVLGTEDRAALGDYFNADGNLIFAGEDLLQGLYDQGGAVRLWYQLKLRINFGTGSSGSLDIVGLPGTVGAGLDFTLSGGDPDLIVLMSGQEEYVTEAFRFGNDEPAGTQTEYSGYKALMLPWGLERVPTEADRNAIIHGALDWFGMLDPLAAEDLPGAGTVLLQNAPNPFNPITKISFVMDQTGPARLEIFNARGQLVRVLADETIAAGAHSIVWDGQTTSGQQAASGTYFYRLTTAGDELTNKMSLVK